VLVTVGIGSGLATSFFNDKNRTIAKDLVEILVESHQEIPQWLQTLAYQTPSGDGNMKKAMAKR